jgi:hypothetical protein
MVGPIQEHELLRLILRAQRLTDLGEFELSTNLLLRIVRDLTEESSPLLCDYYAQMVGLVAFNHFKRGDIERAITETENAKRFCEQVGDREGVAIYSENRAVLAAR